MRKIGSLLTMLILSSVLAFAQTRTVTGVVRDEKGDPIPFATVTEAGTRNAVQADANGNFTIKVGDNSRLAVSATGFSAQTISVTGNTANFSLTRSDSQLQEVVVTGAYNTKRTARGTSYNAQVVGGEQLNVIRQPSINNALAGKVSGIQVRSQSSAALGRSGEVRLRGASGLGTGENVIYVVDGTILPNADDINMDDVQDVTVLQGPAAAAQFGPQGANGAIVITMKKGSKNQRGNGIEVNLGATFDKVSKLPNYQNSYAGGSSADLIRYVWEPGDPEEWKALDGKFYHNYTDDASWGPRMVGQEYVPWYSWYGGHKYSYTTDKLTPKPDNAKEFFETGVLLNNSLSFSKATENMNLRFSYGNVYINGLLPTTDLKKNTFNLNGSVDLNKHFTVGANINYITQKVTGEISDEYSNQSTGSFNQWFHRNVDMKKMKELKDVRTPDGIWASWNLGSDPNNYNPNDPRGFYAGNFWYNFYKWFDLATTINNRDRLFGDLNLTYNVNNDLSFRATYRKQQANTWFEEKFSSDLAVSGLQTTGNEERAKGYYETYTAISNRQNFELLGTYSKTVNDFKFNINAGTDFFSWLYKENRAHTRDGLNVPNLFTVGNSKSTPNITNDRIEEKYRAVFGRGDIGWRNMLFADFTLRNDWFSTLPQDDNAVLSKSVGGSFVFSDLVKGSLPWLTFGKVRASWGEIPQALGTSATTFGAYRYPGFEYGVSPDQWNGNFLMNTPDQLVDSAIHGAVKTQKEVGIELRFLKNRLGVTTTYWDGTEKDIPRAITVNGASGFNSYLVNTGEITKKGIDIQLMARPINSNNVRWEINGTYARLLENKVVKIHETAKRIQVQATYSASTPYLVHEEGQQWGQIYGSGIKRINGQPVLNADGTYAIDPNVYFGNVLPKHTGGLQNSFTLFRDFTVNANIDYQFGGKFFSLSDLWGSYSGLTARTAAINDRGESVRTPVADGGGVHVFGVDEDGKAVDYYVDAQTYFQQSYNNKVFDEYIYDLTFIKLRELSIGYNIPVDKLGINKWANRATFMLVARNPVLIYAKTDDFDPSEVSRVSGEQGQLPGTRGYGFNLRIGF